MSPSGVEWSLWVNGTLAATGLLLWRVWVDADLSAGSEGSTPACQDVHGGRRSESCGWARRGGRRHARVVHTRPGRRGWGNRMGRRLWGAPSSWQLGRLARPPEPNEDARVWSTRRYPARHPPNPRRETSERREGSPSTACGCGASMLGAGLRARIVQALENSKARDGATFPLDLEGESATVAESIAAVSVLDCASPEFHSYGGRRGVS